MSLHSVRPRIEERRAASGFRYDLDAVSNFRDRDGTDIQQIERLTGYKRDNAWFGILLRQLRDNVGVEQPAGHSLTASRSRGAAGSCSICNSADGQD